MNIYTFNNVFIYSFSGYTPYSTPPAYADKLCHKLGCDHYCNVRDGVPECTCYHGYRLHYTHDGYSPNTCVDIDECSDYDNNGGCYHYCHNTLGSYYCTCSDEYYLSDDGLSCEKHHLQYPTNTPYRLPTYPGSYPGVQPYPGSKPGSYPGVQPYPGSSYQQYPPASHRHTYLGDDPHFAVLLPSGMFLCYSVQGEHDKVFNLISNPDVHINALFIPDAKREEVTWIGSLGIVTHPRHSGRGNRTYISFSTDNSSITVTHLFGKGEDKQWRTVSLKSIRVSSISLFNGEMWVTRRTGSTKQPTVEVTLSDVKLNFTVKFVGSHLDMFWQEVGEQPELSHGLIGQFFREGVEIDEVRKMLIIPHKEPVPIMRKPIWSFMEREKNTSSIEDDFCWTTMNIGYQGDGLIDGHYIDYVVHDVLSIDFKSTKIHHHE